MEGRDKDKVAKFLIRKCVDDSDFMVVKTKTCEEVPNFSSVRKWITHVMEVKDENVREVAQFLISNRMDDSDFMEVRDRRSGIFLNKVNG